MIDWIKRQWATAVAIGGIALVVVMFMDQQRTLAVTEAKVAVHDSSFVELQKIATSLRDPNIWLRNYLLNHPSIDSAQAIKWSQLNKGPIPDSVGKPLPGISFLNRELLPESGVLQIYRNDSLITIQTLWKFPREKAK